MKNIHLIPTDKSSGLCINGKNGQNICITSNEEIKANVYCLINGALCKTELLNDKIVSRQLSGGATMDICKSEYFEIILTDNKDLIKDGVQAIDDEFLEWFVNNPSCEKVEIEVEFIQTFDNLKDGFYYKIIIPKEEQKQYLIDMMRYDEELGLYNNNTEIGMHTLTDTTTGCNSSRFGKQETLEEAAEKESEVQGWGKYESNSEQYAIKQSFIRGAEWQAERMYSEEKLKEAFRQGQDNMEYSEMFGWDSKLTEQQWFEQFKKK